MSFVKFNILSVKARMSLVQERLISLGYKCSVTGKRDKQTVKSIQDIQKKNDITPNGVICEKTYNALFETN